MGVFDLRCGLSGLSTMWPGKWEDEHVSLTWSMLLLEKRDRHWIPLSPPVSGIYDRYGRIELWARHQSEHTRWVERQLESLHRLERLTFDHPEGLDHVRRRNAQDTHGTRIPLYLAQASSAVFSHHAMKHEGRDVRPAIFLDEAADVMASSLSLPRLPEEEAFLQRLARRSALREDADLELAYADWLDSQQRPIHATFLRAQHERRQRGVFEHVPAESVPVVERLHRVLHWAEGRGGLGPITANNSGQDGESDVRRIAREAWKRGGPDVRSLLEARRPEWVRRWSQDEERRAVKAVLEAPVPVDTPSRAYSPAQRFAVGEVIAHKTFGLGRVESIDGAKIHVRFGPQVKVLVQAG